MLYIILLLITILVLFWLGFFSWQRRFKPGVAAFSVMMFLGAAWCAVITLMLISPSRDMALFWYRTGFISISLLPIIMLAFIAQYSGSRLIAGTRLTLMIIIPIVTQAAVWTDDHFHLFFESINIVEKNGLMVIQAWSPGPWFIVHSVYSFAIMLAAIVWLFIYAVKQYRVFRGQSIAFIMGALMVTLPNLAFAVGLIPPDVILLPFTFLGMGLFIGWAIFRHNLLEVIPVARDKMIDIMSDGMIVLDNDKRVVDMNPAAGDMLALTGEDVIGQTAARVFSPWPDIIERFADVDRTQTEICIPSGDDESYYDVRITGLVDKRKRPAGRLILFRDITRRKRIEKEKDRLLSDLNQKNKELELLYGMALDANPMTGLPGNNSISAAISKAIGNKVDFCVIYTDLDNFKAFNDKYGFAVGDEVIKFTADVLNRSLAAVDCEESFLGHIGGDDFVLIVPMEKTKAVVEFIIRKFDADVVKFYNDNDLAQGFISSTNRRGIKEDFPIMTISMAGVDLSLNRYHEYIEVNDACAELKKKAKSIPGSNFYLDHRMG